MSSKHLIGQISITITGTSQFETRGALIDKRSGTARPIGGMKAADYREAAQHALDMAAGMVVAIGELEALETEPTFKPVKNVNINQ